MADLEPPVAKYKLTLTVYGPIEEPQPRDDPPVNVGYPMQVYAERVGFIHREDER